MEIQKLRLEPGDVLVVRADQYLSKDQKTTLAAAWRETLDKAGFADIRLMIIGSELSLSVLSKAA